MVRLAVSRRSVQEKFKRSRSIQVLTGSISITMIITFYFFVSSIITTTRHHSFALVAATLPIISIHCIHYSIAVASHIKIEKYYVVRSIIYHSATIMSSDDSSINDQQRSGPNAQQNSSTKKTVNTTTTATTSSSTSTYDKYMELTQRVLQKSRKSLDTKAYIQEAYGEEKMAVLGGSDMLQGILDGLLDKMTNETLLVDFAEYCNTEHDDENNNDGNKQSPKDRMDQIDEAIRFVLDWEARRDEIDNNDSQSALQSLDASLLPEGVTTEDVVRYREYQQQLQARNALQEELQKVEEQVAAMQDEHEQIKKSIQAQLEKAKNAERQVEDAANACAMVTN